MKERETKKWEKSEDRKGRINVYVWGRERVKENDRKKECLGGRERRSNRRRKTLWVIEKEKVRHEWRENEKDSNV